MSLPSTLAASSAPSTEPVSLTVLSGGVRTLVQDEGRHGYAHLGVPVAGAADQEAYALANRLVGNPRGTAALEVTMSGPTLRFTHDARIAYAGPDVDLTVDGRPAPLHHTVLVRAGQVVSVGALRGGLYGYLAVAGGLNIDPVLGSRSRDTLAGVGPGVLTQGDILSCGQPGEPVLRAARVERASHRRVRYLPGPHSDWFPVDVHERFSAHDWQVDPESSRVGIRFQGPGVEVSDEPLSSMGMTKGAIQVPSSGQPIVLGADHGTTGGYPVLGVVLPVDLSTLTQAPAGTRVRFAAVSWAEAEAAAETDFCRVWELAEVS